MTTTIQRPRVITAPPPEKPRTIAEQRADWERELMGCLLGNLHDTLQAASWLPADTIQDPRFAELWRRMVEAGPNMDTLFNVAYDMGIYGTVVGCMNENSTWAHAGHIAEQIQRLTWLDRSNGDLAKLAQLQARGDTSEVVAILDRLQTSQPKSATPQRVRDMSDAGEAFLLLLDGGERTISTGIPLLDAATGGMERQNQTIIAAPPSTGKSALAFQIARNVAASGKKAMFFSFEMSEANLFSRAACGLAGVTWQDVRRRSITSAQRAKVEEVASDLMFATGRRLLIHDQSTDLAQMWRMVTSERPDLVVVDHIRFVTDQPNDMKENKRLGWLSQRLRDMAKQFNCHALVLSQLSRHTDRSDKRPLLTDLRDSGELEENADNVWMLYVPADGSSAATNRNLVDCEIWLRKQRDGMRDVRVDLQFDRRMQWFKAKGEYA